MATKHIKDITKLSQLEFDDIVIGENQYEVTYTHWEDGKPKFLIGDRNSKNPYQIGRYVTGFKAMCKLLKE